MAQTSLALVTYYLTTGLCPFASEIQLALWTFCSEIILWLVYLATYTGLLICRLVCPLFGTLLVPTAYFRFNFVSGSRRTVQRKAPRCQLLGSDIIFAFDERLLLFSHFRLHRHWCYLFNSKARYNVALTRSIDHGYAFAYRPCQFCFKHGQAEPPPGIVLGIVHFAMICCVHSFLFVRVAAYAVYCRCKRFSIQEIYRRCKQFPEVLMTMMRL